MPIDGLYQSLSLSIYLSIYLTVYLSFYVSIYLSFYVSIYLSLSLSLNRPLKNYASIRGERIQIRINFSRVVSPLIQPAPIIWLIRAVSAQIIRFGPIFFLCVGGGRGRRLRIFSLCFYELLNHYIIEEYQKKDIRVAL